MLDTTFLHMPGITLQTRLGCKQAFAEHLCSTYRPHSGVHLHFTDTCATSGHPAKSESKKIAPARQRIQTSS